MGVFMNKNSVSEETLDIENFEESLKGLSVPVIICFSAKWCMYCKMMDTVLGKLKEDLGNEFLIKKIDVDEYPEIAKKYNIMSLPTTIFFKGGELVRRETGFLAGEKIWEIIKSDF